MIKPMSREKFGHTNIKAYCAYHGVEHVEGWEWKDVDKKMGLTPSEDTDVQYEEYLALIKIINSPLYKALK